MIAIVLLCAILTGPFQQQMERSYHDYLKEQKVNQQKYDVQERLRIRRCFHKFSGYDPDSVDETKTCWLENMGFRETLRVGQDDVDDCPSGWEIQVVCKSCGKIAWSGWSNSPIVLWHDWKIGQADYVHFCGQKRKEKR